MAKNPITALITGLRTLNWTLKRWDLLILHDAKEVSLSICPPAMLRHFVIQAYTQVLVDKFETKLKNHHPDHYDPAYAARRMALNLQVTPYHHEQVPIRAIQITLSKLGSANTLKARTMLRLISGSVLTRVHARKQGHLVEANCPMCGEPDTVEHRVHSCFCSAIDQDKPPYLSSVSSQRGIHMLPPVPKAPGDFILAFYLDGAQVDHFTCDPRDGPIYTDGSVYEGNHISLARGGCAAAQPGAKKVLQYTIESDLPATAAVTEHVGLLLAATYTDATANNIAHIYADCAGLVSFIDRQHQALAYSCPMAGIWRQIIEKPAWPHMRIHNTKAHRSLAQATKADDHQHFLGNDIADGSAKEAAGKHKVQDPELSAFVRAAKHTQTSLTQVVEALIKYNTFVLPLELQPLPPVVKRQDHTPKV
jgi:predicted RNA-binding Zn-ribbon protein involved in translation (DUF1610 family)